MKYYLTITGISLLFLLNSCANNGVPSDVLPPEKMQKVLWDLLRSDELVAEKRISDTGLKVDAYSEKLYAQVFAMHQIDKETFQRSFQFYQGRPDLSKTLFDSIISVGNKQKELRIRADSLKVAKTAALDSAKNAQAAKAARDSAALKTDSLKIKADSLRLKKDSILKRTKLRFKKKPV